MSSLAGPSTSRDPEYDKYRQKFKRLRILIIGRANAGKTSILRALCGTEEDLEIYNSKGDRINSEGERIRGAKDINGDHAVEVTLFLAPLVTHLNIESLAGC